MTLAITNTKRWFDGQRIHQVGTILASGSYVSGGDVLDFRDGEIKSSRIPDHVELQGIAGWQYSYDPQTDIGDGLMLAFFAGIEEGAGVYDAAIIADTIRYHAIFPSR